MLSLSKSQYIRGLQCPKALWLHKFHPDLRDVADQGRQAAFDSGTDVGKLAQDLFPGGVEIAFEDGKEKRGQIYLRRKRVVIDWKEKRGQIYLRRKRVVIDCSGVENKSVPFFFSSPPARVKTPSR